MQFGQAFVHILPKEHAGRTLKVGRAYTAPDVESEMSEVRSGVAHACRAHVQSAGPSHHVFVRGVWLDLDDDEPGDAQAAKAETHVVRVVERPAGGP